MWSFDPSAGELTFAAQRLTYQEVRSTKASPRRRGASNRGVWSNVVEVAERFEAHITFTESSVGDDGTITLRGAEGYLTISAPAEGVLEFLVHPPADDVYAFYPVKYVVDLADPTMVQAEPGAGTVAADPWIGGSELICRCDTAGCGGGCTNAKCDDIKTCDGRCGACAWIATDAY